MTTEHCIQVLREAANRLEATKGLRPAVCRLIIRGEWLKIHAVLDDLEFCVMPALAGIAEGSRSPIPTERT